LIRCLSNDIKEEKQDPDIIWKCVRQQQEQEQRQRQERQQQQQQEQEQEQQQRTQTQNYALSESSSLNSSFSSSQSFSNPPLFAEDTEDTARASIPVTNVTPPSALSPMESKGKICIVCGKSQSQAITSSQRPPSIRIGGSRELMICKKEHLKLPHEQPTASSDEESSLSMLYRKIHQELNLSRDHGDAADAGSLILQGSGDTSWKWEHRNCHGLTIERDSGKYVSCEQQTENSLLWLIISDQAKYFCSGPCMIRYLNYHFAQARSGSSSSRKSEKRKRKERQSERGNNE
jgi:hypothetical protein